MAYNKSPFVIWNIAGKDIGIFYQLNFQIADSHNTDALHGFDIKNLGI